LDAQSALYFNQPGVRCLRRTRKRPAVSGEALIYPGTADQHLNTVKQIGLQGDLVSYRGLHLMQRYALPPQTAAAMAGLAFGFDQ
jgi:hypothetical protein